MNEAPSGDRTYVERQYRLMMLDNQVERFNKAKIAERRWRYGRIALGLAPLVAAGSVYSTHIGDRLDRTEKFAGDIYALVAGALGATAGDVVRVKKHKKAKEISIRTVPIVESLGVTMPRPMQQAIESELS